MLIASILISLLITVRYFEYNLFIKRALRFAHLYDCRFATEQFKDKDDYKYIVDMLDNKYIRKCDWSMINYFAKNTPSFTQTLFMFKTLNIENVYNNDVVSKLKHYKVI